ncbi:MAG TPA: hypothetical protein ENI67_04665, partial [Gammaproteobacteria bacterium]|nr:hypothetical protein [Gammaproteobacteria bacterium]
MTTASGVPYGPGSTRSSIPSGIAALDKLSSAQADCYAAQPKVSSMSITDVKSLSAAGQAAYFRAKETASVVRAVRLAAGQQEMSPCSQIARSFYQAQIAYEHEVMGVVGTGLKIVGTAIGIYAFGSYIIAPLASAAVAGAGTRVLNIGGTRGTTSSPGSVPAGSTVTQPGLASSSGNDSFAFTDTQINMGDRAITSGGAGGFNPAGPIGFDQFKYLPGSGFISDRAPQSIYQPGVTQPVNNVSPSSSNHTGIL